MKPPQVPLWLGRLALSIIFGAAVRSVPQRKRRRSVGTQVLTSALVVEDSALQRGHAADLCREFGITRVEEASNGQEALALLEVLSPPPDLLIVDLEMPTMDGAELLEHLARRGICIPIVIASSRGSALLNSVQDMGSAVGLHVVADRQAHVGG